jgi:polyisoprenoid-binding protein YceI
MKKSIYILISIIIFSGFTLIFKENLNNYKIIKNKTVIEFKIEDKLGTERTGYFDAPTGTLVFDKNNIDKSYFDVKINVNSLNTNNTLRDKDLLSSHFFEAEKYPYMNFTSKKIIATANGFEVTGDMKIKDKTREIKIPFKFITGPQGNYFESEFKLKRLDYNVGISNEVIGNEVRIKVKLAVNLTSGS